jgi:glycosidase
MPIPAAHGQAIRWAMRALALVALAIGAGAWAQPAIDTTPVPLADPGSTLPAGWHHGAFMEIFVRAWRDSDGDGIGDLRGLTQTLDHLQDLGVRGIWLMPITRNADGDHGYATTDFRDIAPEYGTLADLDELLAQAHRRGIGVIMDYVINHSAAQHPMFGQALLGAGNAFHDWYVWRSEAPPGWDIWGKNPWYHAGSQPWRFKGDARDAPAPPADARDFYFSTFGPHMPDFNFRQPAVLAYHLDSLRFWLNRGLDGYRLDAVPHLVENSARDWNDQPESRRITRQLQDLIKGYRHRFVVCEATAEPRAYGDPALCGGAFAFGHVQHYIEAARGKPASIRKVATFYRDASPTMATFLSSHDIFAGRRVWDQMGGAADRGNARYKLAAAGYLLQPGTPFIYYGEQIGQAGVPALPGDEPLRGPLSWRADTARGGFTAGAPFRALAPNVATHNVEAQVRDPGSIFHFYKAMLALRNDLPSIARGSFEGGLARGQVAGWQRKLGAETTLVLINYGKRKARVQVAQLPAGALLQAAYPAQARALRVNAKGQAVAALPAQSVGVWVLRP